MLAPRTSTVLQVCPRQSV